MILLPVQAPVRIDVRPDRVLNRVTSDMFGACVEDVNHEVYGGLYAQRIFGESFEEPAPGTSPKGWRVLGGDWFPEGVGVACVRGGDGPKLLREMPDRLDLAAEARVRLASGYTDNAGLLVRVTKAGVGADDFEGYEVSLSATTHAIVVGKHRHDFHLLASAPAPIRAGQWHRLRVTLSGARICAYLDDETTPRIDFTDSDPLGAGKVALRSFRADAAFRDVRIDGVAAPISFAGEGVSRYWDRILTGGAHSRFALEEEAFNGTLCQRIEHREGVGRVGVANRGLNRWGISVHQGHAMEGRVYLRGCVGSATVALESADGSQTYASQRLSVAANWGKASFRLNPNRTDANARFALWIDRPGTLWVDQAVLLDAREDRYRGLPVRKDIANALVGSGLTFMRYGGAMINVPGYRWKRMTGDPDRRAPYAGFWNSCSTHGFGIFEFLNFCEKAKIGAAFTINVNETPEDAADLADYLTAPVSNPWGQRRAADGHPTPYHPAYIQIGNEEGISNSDEAAMAEYAERFRLLAKAIHGRNPELKLVCGAWWTADAPQMRTVFDAVDSVAAAWDLHFWCDDPSSGTAIDRELDRAERLFRSWNAKTTLKAVIFEENGNLHNLQRGLGHATTLNATRRHGDFVLADCAANALQPIGQNDNGWDQGSVFFSPDRAWPMPPAEVQRLLSSDALPLRVEASASGGIDVLATRSEDGRTLCLTLVNVADHPVEAVVSLGSFKARSVRIRTLSGDLAATRVLGAAWRNVGRAENRVSLPAHSVTSLRCRS